MSADAPDRKNAPARNPDGQAVDACGAAGLPGHGTTTPFGPLAGDVAEARSDCLGGRLLKEDLPWKGP